MRRMRFIAGLVAAAAGPGAASAADSGGFAAQVSAVVRPVVEYHIPEFTLLGFSLLVVTVGLERLFALWGRADWFLPPAAVQAVAQATTTGPGPLRQVVKSCTGPYTAVLAQLLDHAGAPSQVLSAVLPAALEVEHDRAAQSAGHLGLLAKLAPFVGLIGTVVGIMLALDPGSAGADGRNAAVAKGLGAALASTAAGILVALVATAAAHLARQRTRTLFLQVQASLTAALPALAGPAPTGDTP